MRQRKASPRDKIAAQLTDTERLRIRRARMQQPAAIETLRHTNLPVHTEKADQTCPECGVQMVRRQRKRDHEAFWGCARFPHCRGRRRIQ